MMFEIISRSGSVHAANISVVLVEAECCVRQVCFLTFLSILSMCYKKKKKKSVCKVATHPREQDFVKGR